MTPGPDAFFWVSTEGSSPSNVQNEAATKILAYPYTDPGYYEYRDQAAPVLPAASNQQITLRLPGEMKVRLARREIVCFQQGVSYQT